MTNELFFIALSSGLGAGIVATLVTLAVERFGGRLGGIIGTLPTTIVPASWGLWKQLYSTHPEITDYSLFASSMYAVPAGMGLNALFLWLWRTLPPLLPSMTRAKTVTCLTLMTLSAWFLGAYLWVSISHDYLSTLVTQWHGGWMATLILIILGVIATFKPREAPKGSQPVTTTTIIIRGLGACIAVSIAVVIAQTGESTLAGIAAVFPAIFLTTMLSLWLSQGQHVPSGAVGPMMIGSSSVAFFALSAPSLYPYFGPELGALLAWLLAVICGSVPSYLWVSYRSSKIHL